MMIGIVSVAFGQWALFALLVVLRPARSKAPVLISTAVLFAAWMAAFLPPLLAEQSAAKPTTSEASAIATRTHGSCAAVQINDSAASVAKKLGPPDEKLNDDSVRGPGATTWVYRDTRCAVHIIDNEVDFVE